MHRKQLLRAIAGVLSITIVGLTCVTAAPAATEKVLHTFIGVTQRGAYPQGSLVADAVGNLYGTTSQGGAYGYGTVFELMPGSEGEWEESVLYSFQNGNDGADPSPGLVFDTAGNLYGTCLRGPVTAGSVFELSPSSKGWAETTLYTFTGGDDGGEPNGSLVFDKAGNLYGTTVSSDYGNMEGTVFELVRGGSGQWTETVLHTFTGYDGGYPAGGVILDEGGNLYGTTQHGGNLQSCQNYNPPGCGTVFSLTPGRNGSWSETTLHFFTGNYPYDGALPSGSLTIDASGNLYGAAGVVFRLLRGNWKEEILFDFSGGNEGANPNGGLVFDSVGSLYGTALYGGNSGCPFNNNSYGCGTVFKLSPGKDDAWKERTLYRFTGQKDGGIPVGGVVLDSAGNLYGAASAEGIAGKGIIFKVASESGNHWKESAIYGFTSSDGSAPTASLVSDSEGNLYGTTFGGGNGSNAWPCGGSCGTVFRLGHDLLGHWTKSLLYSFKGGNDGANPAAGLIFDQAGNLYGTTQTGGVQEEGTVYKLSNVSGHWVENLIYSFHGVDGVSPNGGVIFDGAGNLYGTTVSGGAYEVGTVYKLSPSSGGVWTETVLYSFHGSSDGGSPNGGVTFDAEGNLYGTASDGGENCGGYGCGVVFKLAPSSGGWTEMVLYAFTGGSDGDNPSGGLVFDSFGSLYGTTFDGGDSNCAGYHTYGCGTVFQLSPGFVWTETVIHTFGGGHGADRRARSNFDNANRRYSPIGRSGRPPKCDSERRDSGYNEDGANPEGGLVFDSAGNLYGTTAFGGYSLDGCAYDGYGTVFELSPLGGGEWKEEALRRFTGADGENPAAGVILDSTGDIYGTTQNGGDIRGGYYSGFGTAFEITP